MVARGESTPALDPYTRRVRPDRERTDAIPNLETNRPHDRRGHAGDPGVRRARADQRAGRLCPPGRTPHRPIVAAVAAARRRSRLGGRHRIASFARQAPSSGALSGRLVRRRPGHPRGTGRDVPHPRRTVDLRHRDGQARYVAAATPRGACGRASPFSPRRANLPTPAVAHRRLIDRPSTGPTDRAPSRVACGHRHAATSSDPSFERRGPGEPAGASRTRPRLRG